MDLETGQLLMVGFHGTEPGQEWPERLARQAGQGLVGGVILFKYNIESPAQVKELNAALRGSGKGMPLLVAVDQEGGRVQRLDPSNGFKDHLSAKEVASRMTAGEALAHYGSMAAMVAEAGFNVVFGPVADLDGPEPSPVIGGKERSYGSKPEAVADFGGAFVDAMRAAGIATSLKHFPGHGRARGDTHAGLVDVTATWTEDELLPFKLLIERGKADIVMTAHILHRGFDPSGPATLSPAILQGLLREKLRFDGVVSTDDLHMGAIQQNFGFEEAVVRALDAGADLLLLGNNPSGAQGVPDFTPDPAIPERFAETVEKAVRAGRLDEERLAASCARVARLRQGLAKASSTS